MPPVDEMVVTVLDGSSPELVFTALGILINLTTDEEHRDRLKQTDGISKWDAHESREGARHEESEGRACLYRATATEEVEDDCDKGSQLILLRGAWRDRDTNDIFCSLLPHFYFLDFKFSNFVCPSEFHPLIWFFFKNSFRKKKNIQKNHPKRLSS